MGWLRWLWDWGGEETPVYGLGCVHIAWAAPSCTVAYSVPSVTVAHSGPSVVVSWEVC